MMEQLYTRPDKRGRSVPFDESKHKRDWQGKFTRMYNKATKPTNARGPRRLSPVTTPINRGQGKVMTRRQNWAPIPWSRRTKIGKLVGLFDGSWRRWRKSELRRKARLARKQGGMGHGL